MTQEDNEDFENSTKCGFCCNDYIDNDAKVWDHCQITGKYRDSAHRDCNIIVKLNHKILVEFRNLKNYDLHLTIKELGKFNLKTNAITKGLENCMSFSINNKLIFINSFHFLSYFETSWKLNKDDFRYLSREFDNNVLDL